MTLKWAALADLPGEGRTLLRLRGPDTERFLQGTLSGDLDGMKPGEALAAALLTVKGKLVSDAIVLGLGPDELGLAVPTQLAEPVRELLDRHIIMDEVEVVLDDERVFALAWGEGADQLRVDGALGFSTRHPAPGQLLMGTPEALAAGLPEAAKVDADGWTAYRIETASPAWGRELSVDRFPPEAGFVHGVSYDKGCFLGQEPLSRIHSRSQVNWVMVRVSARNGPANGAQLRHPDRENAGQWTSWASTEDGVRGLAIVRRSLAIEGTELSVDGGATVTVRSGPLGDDPGVRV